MTSYQPAVLLAVSKASFTSSVFSAFTRGLAFALALSFALISTNTSAQSSTLQQAISSGQINADLRLRYEHAAQDNALDNADALTLRTLLGYTTQPWQGLSAFVEMENVSALVDDYSGTPPPRRYSVIADPTGTELNQWALRYSGIKDLTATLGRSRLIFDNARWVGNVGWRQNEQTYDGAFLKATPSKAVTLNYAYLSNVNSIFFTNMPLHGHIGHAQWTHSPALGVSAYAYLLNFEKLTTATPDADTYGLRAGGKTALSPALGLLYTAEFAVQTAETAAGDFTARYRMAEFGLVYQGVTAKIGHETLGSDGGRYAVMTPLATLHAFNGWTDQFLVTPATGLQDLNASVGGKLKSFSWLAEYHDFIADEGGLHYGSEWGLQVTRPLNAKLLAGIKYSAYQADDRPTDTDRFWAWLQFKL